MLKVIKNITVTDVESNLQNVGVESDNDNKSIIIKCPIGGYYPSKTYYLYINNKLLYRLNFVSIIIL